MPDSVKISTGLKTANLNQEIKAPGPRSAAIFAREERYCAHNYEPMPVAITRGKGKKQTPQQTADFFKKKF